MSKPSLLYVTPIVPATTGSGLPMRAALILRALSERYRVFLLVIPRYSSKGASVPDELAALCDQIVELPIDQAAHRAPLVTRLLARAARTAPLSSPGRDATDASRDAFPGEDFDVIHVAQLESVAFVQQCLGAPVRRRLHLELADIASTTHRRFADLQRRNGHPLRAQCEAALAARVAAVEDAVFPRFDRIYVCSERERAEVLTRTDSEVRVLPNVAELREPLPARKREGPFNFLFVGYLGYLPNHDAVRYFCFEVVPEIRRRTEEEFTITIVGTGPLDWVRECRRVPEVRLIGAVPEVDPWYRDADAVVVPIRAGGGIRIKILEAFSFGRPVVSTTIGVEGIEAEDERDLLIADDPEAFAGQCVRLMNDRALSERLVDNAHQLPWDSYSIETVRRAVIPGPQ